MATSLLSQRTQLDYGPSRFDTFQSQPTHIAPSHYNTQLQFNLGVSSSPDNLATKFRKPHPIIIEKLNSNTGTDQPVSHGRRYPVTLETFPQTSQLSVDSSVSSEKLASAIRLAKRDIRKAKEFARLDSQNGPHGTDVEIVQKVPKKVKPKSFKNAASRKQDEVNTLRNRVQSAVRRQAALGPLAPITKCRSQSQETKPQYYFYPLADDGDDECEGSDGEKKQANEIRKLRKELHQYMSQLEQLRHEGPTVLRNKDKRMKKKKESELKLSDEEADRRQIARAEEQAARSARMLYVLQRQVKELEDEINKRGKLIKHTKKSQTLSRLAAAHRGAVRALQSFISHAPLQPKISHGLPPMYQELSLLIRQLSLLSAQLQIGGEGSLPGHILDMKPKKSSGTERHSTEDKAPSQTPSPDKPVRDQPEQTQRGNPNPLVKQLYGSPNPTPERDAILKAGLAALVRARKTPTYQSPSTVKEKTRMSHGQQKLSLQPYKRSVLLPAQLQVKRHKAQVALERARTVNINEAHFAQETVSSKLKKAPPVSPPKVPTKGAPQAFSPGTPVRNDPIGIRPISPGSTRFSPGTSPRSKLEEQMPSPRRMAPLHHDLMEREIARQHWLEKEAEKRLQELDKLCDVAYYRTRDMRHNMDIPQRLVSEAERAIRARLQPLLDRAEAIVDENIRRETQHQQSLRQRLTGLASDATMSQADQLANMILDDVLEDTVDELQRLDSDDQAEEMAENLQNRSTLEVLFQRLQSFEKTEEAIRRHWVQIKYIDTDREMGRSEEEKSGEKGKIKHHEGGKVPRPIVFTSSQPKCDRDFVSERLKHLRKKHRAFGSGTSRVNSNTAGFDNHGIYREESNSSLLEDSLTGNDSSSHDEGRLKHRLRPQALEKPTVVVLVPSEMRASIAANRGRYERYLRQTATHVQGTFDPWKLVEEVSDDLLDDLLTDVAEELQGVCDDFAEGVYLEEFAAVKSNEPSTQSLAS